MTHSRYSNPTSPKSYPTATPFLSIPCNTPIATISSVQKAVDAGIPIIDGAAFLSGIHYERIWDSIAAILQKPHLSPIP